MDREGCKILALCLAAVFLASSCKKDKPDAAFTAPGNINSKVYVVCEGSLGNGNSALTLYDVKERTVYADAFKSANDEQTLGDVFQSMQLIGDRWFLCINNSDKIIAIDRVTRKQVGSVDVPKPRYILPVSATKAYVSTLFSNKLFIINPQTYQVTGNINMPYQNPEGMLLHNGNAYISAWDTANNKIFKVNIATDNIEEEIAVAGRAPQEILDDAYGRLWVLSGNVPKGKPAALTCIDPITNKIVKSYSFPSNADPIRPVFNSNKDQLYFIEVNYSGGTANNGIYRMSVNDGVLPSEPIIHAQQYQYYWALGIEPGTGNLYIGDPKGFIQKGTAYVYDSLGKKITEFNTGIGPGHFYFDNK